jgi:hypothetical protein
MFVWHLALAGGEILNVNNPQTIYALNPSAGIKIAQKTIVGTLFDFIF